jgi:uncharacterized repeat protein (TIGR03803 family)
MASKHSVSTLGIWFREALAGLALAILSVLTPGATQAAQAQSFNVLHNFTGGPDGSAPVAGLTIDPAGNLYGTASAGGTGYGTVFRLVYKNSAWTFTPLYSFAGGNDGGQPQARVVFGPDGTLYGTTAAGAGNGCNGEGCGVVFNLKPSPRACTTALCPWLEAVLYRFSGGGDGGDPNGDVIFDRTGNLYGTTVLGGPDCYFRGCGVVYQLTLSAASGWTERVLYSFSLGDDGAFPVGGLIADNAGNLYGTTFGYSDGIYAPYGTVYELTPSGSGWAEKTLYTFQGGSDGGSPDAGLIADQMGNLYGATTSFGTGGGGTVFEMMPSGGNWTLVTLYGLIGFNGSSQPGPYASLVMDESGSLYGTTRNDGASGNGSVFKLTRQLDGSWTYTSLHDFTGAADGGFPYSNVVFDTNGNLYGTAYRGGAYGGGVVWEITP